ncbi:MAG: pyruvate formate lyase family protein [Eubacteriales bacterium]|nr:pyruvate formate lyase family protein [Eubacteriales bacterium]
MNKKLYDYYIINKEHRRYRRSFGDASLGEQFCTMSVPYEERMASRFEAVCAEERPYIHPLEKIVLVRTCCDVPNCFTADELNRIKKDHFLHERGYVSNLSPNYSKLIASGLLAVRDGATDAQKREIDAIIGLCDRYREKAEQMGRSDIVEVLSRVPRYGARNFREALQMFRILHYALWLEGEYHNTVGRFDMYMYPYFKQDMDKGIYTKESALELLEDFFLSFNKDSDLYPGAQQGDNGQSMVLGGYDAEGNDITNELSLLCLEASRELKIIDPKINLRVSKKTPLEFYRKGTELTRIGLGFPQYSNDDVVIPGLIRLGYSTEDATNYVVAACWEFIIPGVGDDVPNINALNFPKSVDRAIRKCLISGKDYTDLLNEVRAEIYDACDVIRNKVQSLWFAPSPFLDLMRDGKKYRNFGIHGCGIASAADALAAVKTYVYDQKSISGERLLKALDSNFEYDPELLHMLRYEAPKMGAGKSELPDEAADFLLGSFADALEGKKNCLGGIWRAGTGTAMNYLWLAHDLGATADGRRAGEPFGANYSPSLFANIAGPVTVINSFATRNISRNMNGGPLTLEFSSDIFKSEESIEKVAALVKYFISIGGHQLQLNAVDLEKMRDAQLHPELYRQLVVRVWGWSAYFVELDKEYQDHIMARQEYSV